MSAPETTIAATGLTLADLEAMPEDLVRRDLIDGVLYVSPTPVPRHQEVVGRLFRLLADHADNHGGRVFVAPLAVVFADDRVLQPDVFSLGPDRAAQVGPRHVVAPPDLVIEVSSPSTRSHDLVRKRQVYEDGGVAEFWFVDLDAGRIEAYRLHSGRYGHPTLYERGEVAVSTAVPGFAVPVDHAVTG